LFDVKTDDDNSLYKLLLEISQIRPNYEAMIKSGYLKVTEAGIQLGIYILIVILILVRYDYLSHQTHHIDL